MRERSTYVGSPAGQCGGTESLPEVQKTVLEHAPADSGKRWKKAVEVELERDKQMASRTCPKNIDPSLWDKLFIAPIRREIPLLESILSSLN